MDTIFALSSGRGRAGVAVIRLSGPQSGAAIRAMTGGTLPEPRHAALRWLKDPEGGEPLDQALVIWFPEPNSFTGEDCAEFQVHGGAAVVTAVLTVLGRLPEMRPADPGEFARRAFEHGRLDLTAVEGIGDLIDAETEVQRRQAVRQMGGALFEIYEDWRARLVEAMALVEAGIDFADEEIPEDVEAAARPMVQTIRDEIHSALADGQKGERLRDGIEIAILGAPNVGKSSLLNLLARRDVAIVSDIAGTTRDMLEVHLDLGGYPVTIVDTAGLRQGGDVIEEEGIRRARARADAADLRLLMMEAPEWPEVPEDLRPYLGDRSFLLVNKAETRQLHATGAVEGTPVFVMSIKQETGINSLIETLGREAERLLGQGEAAIITRARHRRALEDCLGYLDDYLSGSADVELGAEELRLAARSLGRVTGRVDVEDILDVVFGSFCIGK